ncbi:MAG: hypothetical protein KKD77_21415 [Gammaproteobacteria bacterium]|uniref:Uncharacterized protein n=1 Tax=viral metagenome TaxID=1070528 RepID=A0A6M3LC46_9ZZZZ|nr:hypothetical protein [Gammaproteobacteria bacterium]
MKLVEFQLLCIILLLALLTFIVGRGIKTIELALKYPQIATTHTSYIDAAQVNISDGKFDVAKTKKEKRK